MVHTDPVGSQVGFLCSKMSSPVQALRHNIVKSSWLTYTYSVVIFFFFFCSYLHSCDPPIIHGNLTCDTIFIQHNGLIKIGSGIFLSATGVAGGWFNGLIDLKTFRRNSFTQLHMLYISTSHPLLIREDVSNSDDIRDQCTLPKVCCSAVCYMQNP